MEVQESCVSKREKNKNPERGKGIGLCVKTNVTVSIEEIHNLGYSFIE
jgi:hypothetical protein